MVTERDIKIAKVLRPLGTKPLTMQQARVAFELLDVHWTSVYRLRRRLLGNPVASSVAPNARSPKAGGTRLDGKSKASLTMSLAGRTTPNWQPTRRSTKAAVSAILKLHLSPTPRLPLGLMAPTSAVAVGRQARPAALK